MKFIKSKKLSTIVSIYSLVILIVLNIITAIGIGALANNAMTTKQLEYLVQVQANAKKQVEAYVDKYKALVQESANSPELQDAVAVASKENPIIKNPDFHRIVNTLDRLRQNYKDILTIGLVSVGENNAYLSDGRKIDIVASERPIYTAITENRTYVTQPYVDTVTNSMCISIATPIHHNNKVVGLISADLALDKVSAMLQELSFNETGRLLLLSADNTVIAYENTGLIGSNTTDAGLSGEEWEYALQNPGDDVFTYRYQNDNKVGILAELPEYQWKLLVGLSRKEFFRDIVLNIIALSGFLIASLIISSVLLRKVIAKKLSPITDVNTCLLEMSKGNLQIDIDYNSDDEIGEMAQSLKNCIQSLSSYIHDIDYVLDGFSGGDLTTNFQLQFEGDFQSIQSSIEQFRKKLDLLLRDITIAAEQVSMGSGQIASGAQALAQGATEQAASVQELAAAVTQVSEQIHTNEENSKSASERVNQASVALAHCNTQMQDLESVMGQINEQSGKISNIIKTIEDIAFQTNILALNASVEAARAGTYGKGFAVVANEVGNLSTKSSEASKEITQLIEATISTIEKGLSATEQTAKSLLEVMQQAQGAVSLVDEIAVASQQQASAITQIDIGVSQISTVVQSNSATSEQSAAASEELSGQASVLHDLVNQFELQK